MNAFTASAVALLSKYSNNLLKEDSELALSSKVLGDERATERILRTVINFIDSFEENEYLVRGLYRINGSLVAQQNALRIIENAQGTPLKLYFIYELVAVDKAACIKALLRKMPDTLFPQCQRTALIDLADYIAKQPPAAKDCSENERVFKALQILAYFIPDSHKKCLECLLRHLGEVAAHCAENKMDVSNLGLLFSSYIFPISKNQDSLEKAKDEIECFGRLFPILISNAERLFRMSDELLQTLDASLRKQIDDEQLQLIVSAAATTSNASMNSTYSPLLQTPERLSRRKARKDYDDPEIVMVQTCSTRVLATPTKTKSNTELEMAKLAANIASMSEGPARKRLLKKVQSEQRQKLGIKKSIFKRTFTPS